MARFTSILFTALANIFTGEQAQLAELILHISVQVLGSPAGGGGGGIALYWKKCFLLFRLKIV